MVGKVKKFNLQRGYGFIETDTTDFYFHITSFTRPGAVGIDRKPVVGERVHFDVGEASRPGREREAFKVRPVPVAGLSALAKGGAGGAE